MEVDGQSEYLQHGNSSDESDQGGGGGGQVRTRPHRPQRHHVGPGPLSPSSPGVGGGHITRARAGGTGHRTLKDTKIKPTRSVTSCVGSGGTATHFSGEVPAHCG